MSKPSEFKAWFIQSNGARPSKKEWSIIRRNFINAQDKYIEAKTIYEECERWDNKFNYSLTAWVASKGAEK